ncbi:MAG: 50S ribosomal protein L11 methyltransferase [Hyphomicrobiaceae bacterium]|nr:50S ribosomal protein L11 methyltransferase [Hyphomicrobiaceae bacterium]
MAARKITLNVASRDAARSIAGALQDLIEPLPDALTLFEDKTASGAWRIDAYYETPPEPAALAAELAAILSIEPPALTVEDVPALNWVALSQAALPPVRAGRFTIHGSHDSERVPQGPGAILVDAGEAFGTAHHATTFGCLLAIDRLTRRRRYHSVMDLGCGSGVLAIAARRALPHARVIAADIDPPSVEVARTNARLNRCASSVPMLVAAGLDHPRLRSRRYDLLIANILADPLIALARSIARAVVPGGQVVLSGLLVHQAPAVTAAYRAAGFRLDTHERVDEWSTLVLTRR